MRADVQRAGEQAGRGELRLVCRVPEQRDREADECDAGVLDG